MKFLCVPCDRPMKLRAVAPPERGSLSVVYSCPDCGYEIAMLTNPYETQLVQSLGVRVAPDETFSGPTMRASGPAEAPGAHTGERGTAAPGLQGSRFTDAADSAEGSKCPFATMIQGAESPAAGGQRGLDSQAESVEAPIRWTSAAEARLANIPSFVRPMARTGIERFAREQGCVEIDEKMLDAARDFFGM